MIVTFACVNLAFRQVFPLVYPRDDFPKLTQLSLESAAFQLLAVGNIAVDDVAMTELSLKELPRFFWQLDVVFGIFFEFFSELLQGGMVASFNPVASRRYWRFSGDVLLLYRIFFGFMMNS